MKRLNRIGHSALIAGVAVAVGVGVYAASASARPPRPGGCVCPMVYSPVLCPNGRTYSNMCVAGCDGQTNCTPVIVLPPPID